MDESARVEDVTHVTGFIHGCNFFIGRRTLKCVPMQGKDVVAEADNLKKKLPTKLACTVTEEVIPTTSIKSGTVKNMREKLGNRIHSFRCTTHQESSRDEIKRLEHILKRVVSNIECIHARELNYRQSTSFNPGY